MYRALSHAAGTWPVRKKPAKPSTVIAKEACWSLIHVICLVIVLRLPEMHLLKLALGLKTFLQLTDLWDAVAER